MGLSGSGDKTNQGVLSTFKEENSGAKINLAVFWRVKCYYELFEEDKESNIKEKGVYKGIKKSITKK